jgi:hypothetical protein
MAYSGRGLVLLDLLADRWGVRPHGEGKFIWFEMNGQAGRRRSEAPIHPAPTWPNRT